MSLTEAEERERSADRLLTSSLNHSYDPEIEIDWAAEAVPGRFWMPPKRSSLYGTTLWDQLSHEQRVELTKHEVASAASAGVWFETILMQMLIREYYDQDPRSRHAQYALTEVADECRHSIMFGRLIEASGAQWYKAHWRDHSLGRFIKTTATGAHMYGAILIAEEILDSFQREIMGDDSLQPLIRMVCRIHVIEEARHVSYAREELPRQVARAKRSTLAYSRLVLGRAAYSIVNRLVHPGLYEAVGIPGSLGRRTAMANPQFRETLKWSGRRIVPFLSELGLISGPATVLWRKSGLL